MMPPVEIRIRSREERCLGVRVAREDEEEDEEEQEGGSGQKVKEGQEGVN